MDATVTNRIGENALGRRDCRPAGAFDISFGTIGSRTRAVFWITARVLRLNWRTAALHGYNFKPYDLGAVSFRPGLQFIEIVSPLLHHVPPLGKMRRPVVGAPVRIAHRMG